MSNLKQPFTSNASNLRTLKGTNDGALAGLGRVTPQAVQVEEAVLGAIMIDSYAMSAVLDILTPEVFYVKAHSLIFKAMMQIFNKTHPIDLLTVHEELKKDGTLEEIGGPIYLAELTTKVGSSANIEFHARILVQKFILRELINVSNNIVQDCFEDSKDVFDILDEAEQGLYKITDKNLNQGPQSFASLANKVRLRLEEMAQKPDGLTGVPSGIKKLDEITSGWQNSDLIIIAARPSVGKTALVLSMAVNAAKSDFPVAIFSLEMSTLQMAQRIVSLEAEISSSSLRDGKLDDSDLSRFHTTLQTRSDMQIFIDDTPALNIFELRAKCRRLKTQHDIKLIIIDYLQLMSAGGDSSKMGNNRNLEVSMISRALKNLAKELNVPVIALSQLSRAVEGRADRKPQLSDLRDSGSIEQDADIVGLIYRPDYHGLGDESMTTNSNETGAQLIIAKHRNGSLGDVNLKFIKSFAKYTDATELDYFSSPFGNQKSSDSDQMVVRKSSRANDENFNDVDIPF